MSQTPGNDDPHDLESKFNEDASDNITIRSPDMCMVMRSMTMTTACRLAAYCLGVW